MTDSKVAETKEKTSDTGRFENGPETTEEAWKYSINPLELFKDAYESSNNWLPSGIGFAMDHPEALNSPEWLEIAALDPLIRAGKASIDLVEIPYDMLQDAGAAVKHGLDSIRDYSYAPVDLLTLHPIDAACDVVNGVVHDAKLIGYSAKIVADPFIGVGKAISEVL